MWLVVQFYDGLRRRRLGSDGSAIFKDLKTVQGAERRLRAYRIPGWARTYEIFKVPGEKFYDDSAWKLVARGDVDALRPGGRAAHGDASRRAGKRSSRRSRSSRRGDAVSRTSRGRFAGTPVPAPNPGMNPFAPQARVRLHNRWRLGDVGAVYEFNIKLGLFLRALREEFGRTLKKKYPWIGDVHPTGRSGGWLAVEDPNGKMTKATLATIAKLVEAGKRQFVKDMEEAWPARGRRGR